MIIDLHKPSTLREFSRKNRDYKLLFTSGCFDLLHEGHIYFLNEMRKRAEKIMVEKYGGVGEIRTLVVIHSDTEVTEHKGANRPVYRAEQRLLILDNLKPVDFAGVWDGWESIVDLVYALEPEFLATNSASLKQHNWKDNWQVVAGKLKSHLIGIPVHSESISTTKLIDKIKRLH